MHNGSAKHIKAILARRAATDVAHAKANRDALLEHARMGRDISTLDTDGNVVWIPPAEIFARYGLDEFGRPKPDAAEAK